MASSGARNLEQKEELDWEHDSVDCYTSANQAFRLPEFKSVPDEWVVTKQAQELYKRSVPKQGMVLIAAKQWSEEKKKDVVNIYLFPAFNAYNLRPMKELGKQFPNTIYIKCGTKGVDYVFSDEKGNLKKDDKGNVAGGLLSWEELDLEKEETEEAVLSQREAIVPKIVRLAAQRGQTHADGPIAMVDRFGTPYKSDERVYSPEPLGRNSGWVHSEAVRLAFGPPDRREEQGVKVRHLFGMGIWKGAEGSLLSQVRNKSASLNDLSVNYNPMLRHALFFDPMLGRPADHPELDEEYMLRRTLPAELSLKAVQALVDQLECPPATVKDNFEWVGMEAKTCKSAAEKWWERNQNNPLHLIDKLAYTLSESLRRDRSLTVAQDTLNCIFINFDKLRVNHGYSEADILTLLNKALQEPKTLARDRRNEEAASLFESAASNYFQRKIHEHLRLLNAKLKDKNIEFLLTDIKGALARVATKHPESMDHAIEVYLLLQEFPMNRETMLALVSEAPQGRAVIAEVCSIITKAETNEAQAKLIELFKSLNHGRLILKLKELNLPNDLALLGKLSQESADTQKCEVLIDLFSKLKKTARDQSSVELLIVVDNLINEYSPYARDSVVDESCWRRIMDAPDKSSEIVAEYRHEQTKPFREQPLALLPHSSDLAWMIEALAGRVKFDLKKLMNALVTEFPAQLEAVRTVLVILELYPFQAEMKGHFDMPGFMRKLVKLQQAGLITEDSPLQSHPLIDRFVAIRDPERERLFIDLARKLSKSQQQQNPEYELARETERIISLYSRFRFSSYPRLAFQASIPLDVCERILENPEKEKLLLEANERLRHCQYPAATDLRKQVLAFPETVTELIQVYEHFQTKIDIDESLGEQKEAGAKPFFKSAQHLSVAQRLKEFNLIEKNKIVLAVSARLNTILDPRDTEQFVNLIYKLSLQTPPLTEELLIEKATTLMDRYGEYGRNKRLETKEDSETARLILENPERENEIFSEFYQRQMKSLEEKLQTSFPGAEGAAKVANLIKAVNDYHLDYRLAQKLLHEFRDHSELFYTTCLLLKNYQLSEETTAKIFLSLENMQKLAALCSTGFLNEQDQLFNTNFINRLLAWEPNTYALHFDLFCSVGKKVQQANQDLSGFALIERIEQLLSTYSQFAAEKQTPLPVELCEEILKEPEKENRIRVAFQAMQAHEIPLSGNELVFRQAMNHPDRADYIVEGYKKLLKLGLQNQEELHKLVWDLSELIDQRDALIDLYRKVKALGLDPAYESEMLAKLSSDPDEVLRFITKQFSEKLAELKVDPEMESFLRTIISGHPEKATAILNAYQKVSEWKELEPEERSFFLNKLEQQPLAFVQTLARLSEEKADTDSKLRRLVLSGCYPDKVGKQISLYQKIQSFSPKNNQYSNVDLEQILVSDPELCETLCKIRELKLELREEANLLNICEGDPKAFSRKFEKLSAARLLGNDEVRELVLTTASQRGLDQNEEAHEDQLISLCQKIEEQVMPIGRKFALIHQLGTIDGIAKVTLALAQQQEGPRPSVPR